MPDFERVVDQLRIDLAKTPEQKVYAVGLVAGKNRVRKEAMIVCIVVLVLVVVLPIALHFVK
jgi:hypothetical protein